VSFDHDALDSTTMLLKDHVSGNRAVHTQSEKQTDVDRECVSTEQSGYRSDRQHTQADLILPNQREIQVRQRNQKNSDVGRCARGGQEAHEGESKAKFRHQSRFDPAIF
jgi:hypothetical protein